MVFLGEVFNQGETDEGGQRRIHQSVRHSCPNGVASDEEIESSEGEEQYRKRKDGNDVVPASKTVAIAETAIVTLGNEGFLFAGRMMCVVMPLSFWLEEEAERMSEGAVCSGMLMCYGSFFE